MSGFAYHVDKSGKATRCEIGEALDIADGFVWAHLSTNNEHAKDWLTNVAQLNDYDIMVVKVRGEFVWHAHADTDDFFLVLKGRLTIRLRDREIVLLPGELFVVPRAAEHQPFAEEETHLLLIEPSGTPNTGDAATAAPRRAL